MCRTCGCSDDAQPMLTDLQTGAEVPLSTDREHHEHHHHEEGQAHSHAHDHDHHHDHDHDHDHGHLHIHSHPHEEAAHAHHHGKVIHLEQELLAKNRLLAERNRGWLAGRDILALNLISSPGAGKTTLLERTIHDLGAELPISVIEGDQATLHDAQRIQATGCRVVQINTGAGCHLEADMTARALVQLDPPLHSMVMIENVGNLVCPALFDLGERAKVVIMSVTDGEDKPVKYPHAFRASQIMILNKIDLLPHVQFDVERCLDFARLANPHLRVIQISAIRGDGLEEWYAWLRAQCCEPAVR
jgi:hydrogenase nickel incorporation protein HypB